MGKKSRREKRQWPESSQPEDALEDDKLDQNDEDFFYDEIDKFHAKKDKILLEDVGPLQFEDGDEIDADEEEVLGIGSDSDSEKEWSEPSDSGNEGKGVTSGRAWGKKRSAFYGADTFKGLEGLDREEAEMIEEEEVLAIQKRLAEQIDEDDFGLEILQDAKEVEETTSKGLSHIAADFSTLSSKAQWKLARKESPELEGLIRDFKVKLEELQTEVFPLMKLVKSGKIPEGCGRDYVKLKYNVYLAYLLNISFYLALKAKKTPVQNHPVITRLVQYRTVINQLMPIDKRLRPEIEELLENCISDDEGKVTNSVFHLEHITDEEDFEGGVGCEPTKGNDIKDENEGNDTDKDAGDEKLALDYYKSLGEKLQEDTKQSEEKLEEQEIVTDDRRAINYDIAKNKGLGQKRRKIDRNPRVKMRHKYRKAKIRRKGQVREYRPELKKYSGEASGIRIGLKKSVTLQ